MVFNKKKYKVLHKRHNNVHHAYSTRNGEVLQYVSEKTDLGVIISKDLIPSKQSVNAVKKVSRSSILLKSILDRYWPDRIPVGPITV